MRRALVLLALSLSCGGSTENLFPGDSGKGSTATTTTTATGTATTTTDTTTTGSGGSTTTTSTTTTTDTTTTQTTGGACAGLTKGPGDHQESLQDATGNRSYRVHVPSSYSSDKPTSIVLVFHGYTQSASSIEDTTGMDAVSDGHGFITVYPQGINNSWNAGTCCGTAASQQTGDVAFVGHLLDRLESDYCVDKKRIYATGLSNGGMLSHRLACEMSDRIAAIGAVAGTLAISDCAPTRPVSVMHVHGTADFVVPYDGGNIGGAKSVPETIAAWKTIDKCAGPPVDVYQMGDASCQEHQQCQDGVRLKLCVIDQGGHQWPGGKNNFLGKLSMNLATSEELAKFFEAHPMP